MGQMREVPVSPEPLDRFSGFAPRELLEFSQGHLDEIRTLFHGRVFWQINSTPRGGGVAEMLRGLLAYGRGAGLDARWLTIEAPPEFFRITKRIHHRIHGEAGDGGPLGEEERRLLEAVAEDNAEEFLAVLDPDDVVELHDPQTAAMAPLLSRVCRRVVWRCHIGTDQRNAHTEQVWALLRPYVEAARTTIFSRRAFVPDFLRRTATIIHPSIDIFSPKNSPLSEETVRAILIHTGLVGGEAGGDRSFRRADGAPGRVDRVADLISTGPRPGWDVPLVVQVSRWDPLKDPIGVMQGFASLMRACGCRDAHLILAGPSVHAVQDDPEGAETFNAVTDAWRKLPATERRRVTLAALPMADVDENAVIVNALQRHAAVLVQKSLQEGFGLTVTEAMWKGKPVIASGVGGIREQITHGVDGLLLDDPRDLVAFGELLRQALEDAPLAARLGAAAELRVRRHFLSLRQLSDAVSLALQLFSEDNGHRPRRLEAGSQLQA